MKRPDAVKTVGIVVEDWKAETFKKLLQEAEYEWDECMGPVRDTRLLRVKTDSVAQLAKVVDKAQKECWKMAAMIDQLKGEDDGR